MERDRRAFKSTFSQRNFNSHAHVERDSLLGVAIGVIRISTHTLTWSVTPAVLMLLQGCSDFNSHAHVERDLLSSFTSTIWNISTHTLTWSVTIHGQN